MLERLGQQLLVVRELPVDAARRQPDAVDPEDDLVLVDAELELVAGLRDARRARPARVAGMIASSSGVRSSSVGLLDRRAGRSRSRPSRACPARSGRGCRSAPAATRRARRRADTRATVSSSASRSTGERCTLLDVGQPREVLDGCTCAAGTRGAALDADRPLRRPVLERDVRRRAAGARCRRAGRPGHDDRAFVSDLRLERRAQRELHVGRGELEPPASAREQDAESTWTVVRVDTARETRPSLLQRARPASTVTFIARTDHVSEFNHS